MSPVILLKKYDRMLLLFTFFLSVYNKHIQTHYINIMIRILILLLTLNALFPTAGFSCVCASKMSSALSISDMQALMEKSTTTDADTAVPTSTMNCDHSMNMTCDSECCASCLGVFAVLTSPLTLLPILTISTKPVSGYINFHTRNISPELQPPLV